MIGLSIDGEAGVIQKEANVGSMIQMELSVTLKLRAIGIMGQVLVGVREIGALQKLAWVKINLNAQVIVHGQMILGVMEMEKVQHGVIVETQVGVITRTLSLRIAGNIL